MNCLLGSRSRVNATVFTKRSFVVVMYLVCFTGGLFRSWKPDCRVFLWPWNAMRAPLQSSRLHSWVKNLINSEPNMYEINCSVHYEFTKSMVFTKWVTRLSPAWIHCTECKAIFCYNVLGVSSLLYKTAVWVSYSWLLWMFVNCLGRETINALL